MVLQRALEAPRQHHPQLRTTGISGSSRPKVGTDHCVEDDRIGRSDERGGVGRSCPDLGLEEPEERRGLLDGVEVEIHDDAMRIVERLAYQFAYDAGVATHLSEGLERGSPDGEIADGMVDVQGGHAVTVRDEAAPEYPRFLGFAEART